MRTRLYIDVIDGKPVLFGTKDFGDQEMSAANGWERWFMKK